jgi:hypothetical protein
MMRVRLLASVLTLGLLLAACSRDCVACGNVEVERETIRQVVVNLCASEVPDPEPGEAICAEPATVNYTFVAATQ